MGLHATIVLKRRATYWAGAKWDDVADCIAPGWRIRPEEVPVLGRYADREHLDWDDAKRALCRVAIRMVYPLLETPQRFRHGSGVGSQWRDEPPLDSPRWAYWLKNRTIEQARALLADRDEVVPTEEECVERFPWHVDEDGNEVQWEPTDPRPNPEERLLALEASHRLAEIEEKRAALLAEVEAAATRRQREQIAAVRARLHLGFEESVEAAAEELGIEPRAVLATLRRAGERKVCRSSHRE